MDNHAEMAERQRTLIREYVKQIAKDLRDTATLVDKAMAELDHPDHLISYRDLVHCVTRDLEHLPAQLGSSKLTAVLASLMVYETLAKLEEKALELKDQRLIRDQGRVAFQHEQVIRTWNEEDSGLFRRVLFAPETEEEQPGTLFAELRSYDDRTAAAYHEVPPSHPEWDQLVGKRVRITVEELDDVPADQ